MREFKEIKGARLTTWNRGGGGGGGGLVIELNVDDNINTETRTINFIITEKKKHDMSKLLNRC